MSHPLRGRVLHSISCACITQRIGAALPQPPIATANYDAKYLPFSYQIAPAAMFQFEAIPQIRTREATVRVVVEVTESQPLIDPARGRNIDSGQRIVIPLFRTKISARNSREVIRGYAPLFGPTVKVSPPIHPGLHRNQARPQRSTSTQDRGQPTEPHTRGHRPSSRRGHRKPTTQRPRQRPEHGQRT